MSDILEAAPVVVEETKPDAAVVETEQTDGEAETQPDDEARKSRSERRKEARDLSQQKLNDAITARQQAEQSLAEFKAAAEKLPQPKQADFSTFEDYQAALTAFHVTRMTDGREAQRIEAEARNQYAQEQAIHLAETQADALNWADQMAEAKRKYSDFEDVAIFQAHIDQRMARQIISSDAAAEIAYFLGKNPDLGRQMALMSDMNLSRAIGRLEAQLSAPPTKAVSTAPAPITPVHGKATVSGNPDKFTAAQFAEWRAKGGTFKL